MSVRHTTQDVDGGTAEQAAPARVVLRLFASAREAAGAGRVPLEGATVGAVLDEATRRFGADFAAVVATSRVWCNGEPAGAASPLHDGDEVAVLPPVSGGSGTPDRPGPHRP